MPIQEREKPFLAQTVAGEYIESHDYSLFQRVENFSVLNRAKQNGAINFSLAPNIPTGNMENPHTKVFSKEQKDRLYAKCAIPLIIGCLPCITKTEIVSIMI
jgi:hypothetical protein